MFVFFNVDFDKVLECIEDIVNGEQFQELQVSTTVLLRISVNRP